MIFADDREPRPTGTPGASSGALIRCGEAPGPLQTISDRKGDCVNLDVRFNSIFCPFKLGFHANGDNNVPTLL